MRNVSAMQSKDYGREGLSHISVSSKVHHGNRKVGSDAPFLTAMTVMAAVSM